MWWPEYVPYPPARPAERRRSTETWSRRSIRGENCGSVPSSSRMSVARQSCRELELIEPRAGEVRVRMLASGVCHSDLHVRDGGGIDLTPIVMGHEERGHRRGRRSGRDHAPVGQLVALSWLIPCGVCRSCRRGAHLGASRPSYGTRCWTARRRSVASGPTARSEPWPRQPWCRPPPPYPSPMASTRRRADRLLRDDGRRGRPQDRERAGDRRSPDRPGRRRAVVFDGCGRGGCVADRGHRPRHQSWTSRDRSGPRTGCSPTTMPPPRSGAPRPDRRRTGSSSRRSAGHRPPAGHLRLAGRRHRGPCRHDFDIGERASFEVIHSSTVRADPWLELSLGTRGRFSALCRVGGRGSAPGRSPDRPPHRSRRHRRRLRRDACGTVRPAGDHVLTGAASGASAPR